jgi:hypothetical protein
MYLVRRVCKTKPGQAWAVAGYLAKICEAYEANGRDKARIYIEGQGLPGTPNRVYAEWTQDAIEPNWFSKVPQTVREYNPKMQELLDEYLLEIFEVATAEKLVERGVAQ